MPILSDKFCCPACGHPQSHVTHVKTLAVDTRAVDIWRRRKCLACDTPYTTIATERIVGHTIVFNLKIGAIDSTVVSE